ncbi:DUF1707 domain-containing protein [Streptomyces sp. NPDC058773]|uniref:DUF1707 SHOCT-like domain-containing protein n=1 Tax=Streptomyces sp. NPDC058773 TaxID=3346632 RepID=UPI0036C0B1B2
MDERREPALRIGDRDRDRALDLLATALTEGRLDADEHAHRARQVLQVRTATELAAVTADLPAPELSARERDRKDLREWLEEWRHWLGGAVIMSAVWGVNCLRKHELTYYWPMLPLGVWAAVLVAIAVWPRGGEGGDCDA